MPLLTLHMTTVRFSWQNRLVGNGLPCFPQRADRICGCDGLFDLGVTNSISTIPRVLWLYLYSTDIGLGPDAKFSLFRLTVGKLWPCLCCLFGEKTGSYLAIIIALLTSFLSLKRTNRFVWTWNELKSRCQRAI